MAAVDDGQSNPVTPSCNVGETLNRTWLVVGEAVLQYSQNPREEPYSKDLGFGEREKSSERESEREKDTSSNSNRICKPDGKHSVLFCFASRVESGQVSGQLSTTTFAVARATRYVANAGQGRPTTAVGPNLTLEILRRVLFVHAYISEVGELATSY